MRKATPTLLAAGLLSSLLFSSLLPAQTAQNGAAPGRYQLGTPTTPELRFADDPVFNSTFLASLSPSTGKIYEPTGTARGIHQIQMVKTSQDKAGQWTTSMTMSGLAKAYGGATGFSGFNNQWILIGQYDSTTTPETFTPSPLGNNLNSPNGHNFGCMLEPSKGLFATVDWTTGPQLAYRTSDTQPFPKPIPISGFTARYVDPTPAFVDGVLHLFWADHSNTKAVVYSPLLTSIQSGVLKTASVSGMPKILWQPSPGLAHSPMPIIDKNGNAQGFFLANNAAGTGGGISDMFFLAGLDGSKEPAHLVYASSTWLNNGTVAGGTFRFANNGSTPVKRGRASWLVGSNTALQGTATMTSAAWNPNPGTTPIVATAVFLSLMLNKGTMPGITIPGFEGHYALNGSILFIANQVSISKDETVYWGSTVPNNPLLKGVRISVQGLSLLPNLPVLASTATLEFK